MRRALLVAALGCGILVVLSTEGLSALHALNRSGIVVFWAVVFVAASAWLWKTGFFARGLALATRRARAFAQFLRASLPRAILLLALVLFVAALGLVALHAPPNTFDSLTYHLARVAHWAQNESVAIYPTAISRQYEYPALAEYSVLHLQILSGDDRFANLVQYAAYLGCILVASLIAQAMGLSGDGQLLAGITTASIPMAVVQASGTQTDLVASFWLASAVYWILVADQFSLRTSAFLVGASLALAAFVKFPAVIFASALFVGYVFRLVKKIGWRRTLVPAVLIVAAMCVFVQGAFFARRVELTSRALLARFESSAPNISDSSLASELSLRYINRRIDPPAVLSNLVRNAALHLGLPLPEWNAALTRMITWIHFGIGVNANDDATTYPARTWSRVKFVMHEDETGNFIALLLALAAIVWALAGRDAARTQWHAYLALLGLGAAFFILILKWELWNSRLHTPLFVLAAPLIAAFLINILPIYGTQLAALGLLAAALPWLFWAQPRPLLGAASVLREPRQAQYFANAPALAQPYENAVAYVQALACHAIGLWWGGNDFEYPLFALLNARHYAARIEHVNVNNLSQFAAPNHPPFQPCVILAYNSAAAELFWRDTRYVLRAAWKPISVFEASTP
jgi:hypothetical protein